MASNVELACSANLERVFSPLDISGVCNFALCITLLLLLLMDSFCCICTKNRYNCRKDEEVVTLLRSYAKQISINALKKIGAPLLGLAKYIYYLGAHRVQIVYPRPSLHILYYPLPLLRER